MTQKRNLSIGITINLDNYENLRLEVSGEVDGDEDAESLITYLDGILSRMGRGTPETAERVDNYRKRVFSLTPSPVPSGTAGEVVPMPDRNLEQMAARPASSPALTPAHTHEAIEPLPIAMGDRKPSTVPPAVPLKVPSPQKAVSSVTNAKEAGNKDVLTVPTSLEVPKADSPVLSQTIRKEVSLPGKKETTVSLSSVMKKESPATEVSPQSAPTSEVSKEPPKQETFSCERCGESITPVQRKLSRLFQNKDLCKKCLQQL